MQKLQLLLLIWVLVVGCTVVATPTPTSTTAAVNVEPLVDERPSGIPTATVNAEEMEITITPSLTNTTVPTGTPYPKREAASTPVPTLPPKFVEIEAPPIPYDSFWSKLEENGYEVLESTAVIGPKEYTYAAYLLRDPSSFDPILAKSGPEACRLALYGFNESTSELLFTIGAPGPVSICQFGWAEESEFWVGPDHQTTLVRNREILGVSGDWSDINQNSLPEVGVYYNYCFNACVNYGVPETRFYEIHSTSHAEEITATLPGVILPWELLTYPILEHIPVFEVRSITKWDRIESPWIFTWNGNQFMDRTSNYQSEYLAMAEESASKIRGNFADNEHPTWHLESIYTILFNLEKAGLREKGFDLFLELTDPQNWPQATETDIQFLHWVRQEVGQIIQPVLLLDIIFTIVVLTHQGDCVANSGAALLVPSYRLIGGNGQESNSYRLPPSVTVDGVSFYVDVTGEGEPVVLIHAGICDSRMWDEQVPALAMQFRVYRYDMRGYGRTPLTDTTYAHHADLLALFDHWQLEAAHLVGASKGGTVAMDFALAHPNRVRSLVMVGSSPSGFEFEGDEPPLWDDLVAAFKEGDVAQTAELDVQLWVDGWQFRPAGSAPAHVREKVQEMDSIALANEMKGIGQEIQPEHKAYDRLDELQLPLLAIAGDCDDENIQRAATVMADRVPNGRSQIIPDTAHLPNMEKPADFNRLLLDFLKENSEKR